VQDVRAGSKIAHSSQKRGQMSIRLFITKCGVGDFYVQPIASFWA